MTSWAAGEVWVRRWRKKIASQRHSRHLLESVTRDAEAEASTPIEAAAETNSWGAAKSSGDSPPLVSVVIACVNGLPYIVECLEHLADQDDDVHYEAIVVVDACGPEVCDELTGAFLRKWYRSSACHIVYRSQSCVRSASLARGPDDRNSRGSLHKGEVGSSGQASRTTGWRAIGAVENGSTERLTDWAVVYL